MHEMTRRACPLIAHLIATLSLATLAACGGGGDDAADNGNDGGNNNGAAAVSCNTANYQAGTVEQPSTAQLGAYAGTYQGDEGAYGPNPGDPFVKSGSGTLVLGADGSVSYNGTALAASSICIDKAAGPFGTIMYVEAGSGHFDISNQVDATLGSAWGVSPANGAIFTNGRKP